MRSIAQRLQALRHQMREAKLDFFLVPHGDEYQNEYLPVSNERLAWITGFTGSAGFAIVGLERAVVFVDGRYTLQVRRETDEALYEFHHLIEEPPEAWLREHVRPGQRIGYDPWCVTPQQRERYIRAVQHGEGHLVPVSPSPLDTAWGDERPPEPCAPAAPHLTAFSGSSPSEKRARIAAKLAEEDTDALVVTAQDSLAWLLDIRGGDIAHTPVALGYAILRRDGSADLFMDQRKLGPEVRAHLGNEVAVFPPQAIGHSLEGLAGRTVRLDPATAPAWVLDRLDHAGATVRRENDPITLAKATKNDVELDGARAAHRRDGVALVRFFSWLEGALQAGITVKEIEASDRLDGLRAEGVNFRDLSFPTISGAGPNGANPHYRASPDTERALEPGSFYLVDSGAQYLDGTTDVTRTIAIGEPSDEMRDRYTRVLKGHIGLATAVFPKGTCGVHLDAFARAALWRAGVTYDHGTGHGVGSYLGVHEGPQRIAASTPSAPLLPGMVLSNEPGYYKAGAWGIRIENLEIVVPVEIAGAEREMLGFEALTLCPIDKRAIVPEMLTEDERSWLDTYHTRVRETLMPMIHDVAARDWLAKATTPL